MKSITLIIWGEVKLKSIKWNSESGGVVVKGYKMLWKTLDEPSPSEWHFE